MTRVHSQPSGAWLLAVTAVAAVYFYFLLFAEFALLELVGGASPVARVTMGALAAGGLAGSAGAAAWFARERFAATLGACLLVGAGLAATAPSWTTAGGVATGAGAAAVGLALGGATVTLATGLRFWVAEGRLGLAVGAGTGLAYGLANVPVLFAAPATRQAGIAAAVAAVGGLACLLAGARAGAARRAAAGRAAAAVTEAATTTSERAGSQAATVAEPAEVRGTERGTAVWMLAAVGAYAALVWLDSAAFFIIQHTEALRGATWAGASVLWGNAAMHALAALAAGAWLDRGRERTLLAVAFGALAAACFALQTDGEARLAARWAYTAGVSLYSTAFVWRAARTGRPWFTAVLFGAAGWVGSGLGIGMAQDLARVPAGFLAAAGVGLAIALVRLRPGAVRGSRTLALAALLAAAGEDVFKTSLQAAGAARTALEAEAARAAQTSRAAAGGGDVFKNSLQAAEAAEALGRRVYLAEGCIACHSQYVRPGVEAEVWAWGPAAAGGDGAPAQPLYGNRRLGPDLSNVGLRRTPEWNRVHLETPRALTPGSRMPSYARLFREGDPRGPALVAYLAGLGAGREEERRRQVAAWRPAAAPAAISAATSMAAPSTTSTAAPAAAFHPDSVRGARLWAAYCAGCHGPQGRGDGPAAARLTVRPPDFARDAWRRWRPEPAPGTEPEVELLRLIKFGIAGSPMAGHESMSDEDVRVLAAEVVARHAPSRP